MKRSLEEFITANKKKHLVLNYIENEDGCWIHRNKTTHKGYVQLYIDKGSKRKTYHMHRLSYCIFKGEIPEGLFVCHSCDVRNCINPSHLFLGTIADNMNDMSKKFRGRNQLDEDTVGMILVLSESGHSKREIASWFNIHPESISRLKRRQGQ